MVRVARYELRGSCCALRVARYVAERQILLNLQPATLNA